MPNLKKLRRIFLENVNKELSKSQFGRQLLEMRQIYEEFEGKDLDEIISEIKKDISNELSKTELGKVILEKQQNDSLDEKDVDMLKKQLDLDILTELKKTEIGKNIIKKRKSILN